ncbi:hypothetical protein BKA65DRAFT_444961 [Rhexocercosporidium sp. MPI-PUGE-AT-0058]|nr:hypothetical protein BKA65DRAFT_444961 [Rhexocercosporidium sp. MPI-PUGE-AT-0058]
MPSVSSKLYDCIVVGGGPAGLAVASTLGRLNLSALVFDSGVYRNAAAQYLHNVPGWDHTPAAKLRERVRDDLTSRYSLIELSDVSITTVSKLPSGHFEAVDSKENSSTGRTLVLATGIRDVMVEIDGYAECWARGIFHCLICHGFEERGAPSIGVLAVGTTANPRVTAQTSRLASQFGSIITVYTHGDEKLVPTLQEALGNNTQRVVYEHRKIMSIRMEGPKSSGVIVVLEDGTERSEGFLAHSPGFEINGPFVAQLGLDVTEAGYIKTTEPFGETSVPGVFAAGDTMTSVHFITNAALNGGTTGAGIAYMLAGASL